jgi:hypothetical protein
VINRKRQRWVLAGLAVVALAAAGVAPVATAKKKSPSSTTKLRAIPVPPGGSGSTAVGCPKRNHVTGGGYKVDPSFSPAGLTGARTVAIESVPAIFRSWSAGAAAFTTPGVGANVSIFARCEPDDAIKALQTGPPSPSTIPVGLSQTVTMNCTGGGKILSAGYQMSPPPLLSDPTKRGGSVLQSRRSGPSQWTLQVGNPSPPEGVGDIALSTRFLCEKGGKSIKEASSTVAIGDDTRTSADASCPKKQHVISGGFSIAPNVSGAPVPAISVDEFHPNGKTGWHLGLYELSGFALPAGASVTVFAYCKK